MSDLAVIWNAADRIKRDYLRRYWPELADALDIASVAEDFHKQQREAMLTRPVRKNHEPRCPSTHGTDVYPYVARCLLIEGHPFPYDHIDKDGQEWRDEPCEGCKTIRRMEESLLPNDETAAYEFKRAVRHHRKECVNR